MRGLAAAVRPEAFAIYAAPAIKSVEKTTDRIHLKSESARISPGSDRSITWITSPTGYSRFMATTRRAGQGPGAAALFGITPRYAGCVRTLLSIRRLPRRRTVEEKRSGMSSDYTGNRHVQFR